MFPYGILRRRDVVWNPCTPLALVSDKTPHGFRRTFATRAHRAGVTFFSAISESI